MGRRSLLSCLTGFAALVLVANAWGRPGDLDPTFGEGGAASVLRGESEASDLAIGEDDSVIAVGQLRAGDRRPLVARFLPDGRPDPDFGSQGVVASKFGLDTAFAASVAVEPDGQILVGGDGPDAFLARLNRSGELDPEFAGGVIDLEASGRGYVNDLVSERDGTVLLAGERAAETAIARFDASGRPDSSFAGDGTLDFPGRTRLRLDEIATDSGGRILAAGHDAPPDGGPDDDLVLARFLADGSPDTTFAGDGFQAVPCFGIGFCNGPFSVDVGPDGRIAFGATISAGGEFRIPVLTVTDTDGSLLPGFASGGTSHLAAATVVRDVLAESGRALVADIRSLQIETEADDFSAAALSRYRYSDRGEPDPGFGRNGETAVNFSDSLDSFDAVAEQANGDLIAAGQAGQRLIVARFESRSGPPDMDGDGTRNAVDDCPIRPGSDLRGCPRARQEIMLRPRQGGSLASGRNRFAGVLRSPNATCLRHGIRPFIYAARDGRDEVLGRAQLSSYDPDVDVSKRRFEFSGRVPEGRVYARVKKVFVPELGICRAARSARRE